MRREHGHVYAYYSTYLNYIPKIRLIPYPSEMAPVILVSFVITPVFETLETGVAGSRTLEPSSWENTILL